MKNDYKWSVSDLCYIWGGSWGWGGEWWVGEDNLSLKLDLYVQFECTYSDVSKENYYYNNSQKTDIMRQGNQT